MQPNRYALASLLFMASSSIAVCQSLSIYKMQVDGSNQQKIVQLPLATRVNGLALSSDLKHIAWAITTSKNGAPDAGVYVAGYDGKDPHELPLPPGIRGLSNPAFSPDGTRLLITELNEAGRFSIAIEDLDGANRKVIITDGASGSLNANGTRVVFVRETLGTNIHEIIVSDSNGKNERIVARDAFDSLLSLPYFNPGNSNQVIYIARDKNGPVTLDSKTVLALVDVTSGATTDAIPSTPSDYTVLSTNGNIAIYERPALGGKGAALFLSRFGSSDAKEITHDDSTSFSYPQLALDGKTLICFGYRSVSNLQK